MANFFKEYQAQVRERKEQEQRQKQEQERKEEQAKRREYNGYLGGVTLRQFIREIAEDWREAAEDYGSETVEDLIYNENYSEDDIKEAIKNAAYRFQWRAGFSFCKDDYSVELNGKRISYKNILHDLKKYEY